MDLVSKKTLESFIGKNFNEIDQTQFDGYRVRVIGPRDLVTMDLRSDRVNIYVDDDDIVTSVKMG